MNGLEVEVLNKMKNAVKAKLNEIHRESRGSCGQFAGPELPEYVMILLVNKKSQSQMESSLKRFLGTNTSTFVRWLLEVVGKLQEISLPTEKRKDSESLSSITDLIREGLIKKVKQDLQVAAAVKTEVINIDEEEDGEVVSERLRVKEQLEKLQQKINRAKKQLLDRSEESGAQKAKKKPESPPEKRLKSTLSSSKKPDSSLRKTDSGLQKRGRGSSRSPRSRRKSTSPRKKPSSREGRQKFSSERRKSPHEVTSPGGKKLEHSPRSLRLLSLSLGAPEPPDKPPAKPARVSRTPPRLRKRSRTPPRPRRRSRTPETTSIGRRIVEKYDKEKLRNGKTAKRRSPEPPRPPRFRRKRTPEKPEPTTVDGRKKLVSIVANVPRPEETSSKSFRTSRLDEAPRRSSPRRPSPRDPSKLMDAREKLNQIRREKLVVHIENDFAADVIDLNTDDVIIVEEEPEKIDLNETIETEEPTTKFVVTISDRQKRQSATPETPAPPAPKKSRISPIRFDSGEPERQPSPEKKPQIVRLDSVLSKFENLPSLGAPPKPKERCKFFPKCWDSSTCEFFHPSTSCLAFPACSFGDKCLYLHPMCKFDSACIRPDCNFMHSAPKVAPTVVKKVVVVPIVPRPTCKFFPNCTNLSCPFLHPRYCKFGQFCLSKSECPFYHELPPKEKLRWNND